MSGDSPNAFTNENVFDFKEGRSSPAPTTSKEHNQVVTASVLVEPQKEKGKDKEKEGDDDEPDFSSPTLNPGADKSGRRGSADKTLELNDPKFDDLGKDGKKEEQNLLNGGLDRLPNPYARPKEFDEESDDDKCIVNCIYYTMECCKCSII